MAALQPLKDTNSLLRLTQLLSDKEISVVMAAAGALRNLTLAVPDDLAQEIVNAILNFNALVPLIAHLEHVRFSLQPTKTQNIFPVPYHLRYFPCDSDN